MACVDTMGSPNESPGAGVWLHGEAVAAGMVMAADMSLRLGWIEEDILHRTIALLEMAELPTKPPQVFPFGRPFMQLYCARMLALSTGIPEDACAVLECMSVVVASLVRE